MTTYMILELYEKSDFAFAEHIYYWPRVYIYIYIYTYEYIYDPGIIEESRICTLRVYRDIYIYMHMTTYMILELYEKSEFAIAESIYI